MTVREVTQEELDAARHIKFCTLLDGKHLVYGSAEAVVYAYKLNRQAEHAKTYGEDQRFDQFKPQEGK